MKSLLVLALTLFVQNAFALDGMAKHDAHIASLRELYSKGRVPNFDDLKFGQYWKCIQYSAYGHSTEKMEESFKFEFYNDRTVRIDFKNSPGGYFSYSPDTYLLGFYKPSGFGIEDLISTTRITADGALVYEFAAKVTPLSIFQSLVTDHSLYNSRYYAMSYGYCELDK